MSGVAAISAINSVSSSSVAYLPTIQSLQSQLILYAQFANGTGPAAVDFRQLEYAIAIGNVADAQTELARLRRDSEGANPITFAPAGAESANNVSGPGDGESTPPAGSIINTTA